MARITRPPAREDAGVSPVYFRRGQVASVAAAAIVLAVLTGLELGHGGGSAHPSSASCFGALPSQCTPASPGGSRSASSATSPSSAGSPRPAALTAGTATVVAQLAGVPAKAPAPIAKQVNDTASRYDLDAADLGILWDGGDGKVLIAFGDSYGSGFKPATAGGPTADDAADAHWRCNTLGFSTTRDLAAGMQISSMVVDSSGDARQILGCKKSTDSEISVIPTSGIHIGHTDYLSYMSVRDWQTQWSWQTNYSGIAYSTDGGKTWQKSSAKWPNNDLYSDPFQMTAFAEHGGYVYRFGTPNGRAGNAYLSRVPPGSILDPAAYQYWNGSGWVTGDETQAAPVVNAPVGELSVEYDASLGKWLFVSADQSVDALTLRTADSPTGPWSTEQVLVDGTKYQGFYGGFIHPWSSGNDLYFTMSMWGPYQVYLMHTTLTAKPSTGTGSAG